MGQDRSNAAVGRREMPYIDRHEVVGAGGYRAFQKPVVRFMGAGIEADGRVDEVAQRFYTERISERLGLVAF